MGYRVEFDVPEVPLNNPVLEKSEPVGRASSSGLHDSHYVHNDFFNPFFKTKKSLKASVNNLSDSLDNLQTILKKLDDEVQELYQRPEKLVSAHYEQRKANPPEIDPKKPAAVSRSLYEADQEVDEIRRSTNLLIAKKYAQIAGHIEKVWNEAVSLSIWTDSAEVKTLAVHLTASLIDSKIRAHGITREDIDNVSAEIEHLDRFIQDTAIKWDMINSYIPYFLPDSEKIAIPPLGRSESYSVWKAEADSIGTARYEAEKRLTKLIIQRTNLEFRQQNLICGIEEIIERELSSLRIGMPVASTDLSFSPSTLSDGFKIKLQSLLQMTDALARLGEFRLSNLKIGKALELIKHQENKNYDDTALEIALILQRDEQGYLINDGKPKTLEELTNAEELLKSLPRNSTYYELLSHIQLQKSKHYLSIGNKYGMEKGEEALQKSMDRVKELLAAKCFSPNNGLKPPAWLKMIKPEIVPFAMSSSPLVAAVLSDGYKPTSCFNPTEMEAKFLYEAGIILADIKGRSAIEYFRAGKEDESNKYLLESITTILLMEMAFNGLAQKASSVTTLSMFHELTAKGRNLGIGRPLTYCSHIENGLNFVRDYIGKEFPNTGTAWQLKGHNSWIARLNQNLLSPVDGVLKDKFDQEDWNSSMRTLSSHLSSNDTSLTLFFYGGGGSSGTLLGILLGGGGWGMAIGLSAGLLAGFLGDTSTGIITSWGKIKESYNTGISHISTERAGFNTALWVVSLAAISSEAWWSKPAVSGIGSLFPIFKEIGKVTKYGFKQALNFWKGLSIDPLKSLIVQIPVYRLALKDLTFGEAYSGVVKLFSPASLQKAKDVLSLVMKERYAFPLANGFRDPLIQSLHITYDLATLASYTWFGLTTAENLFKEAGIDFEDTIFHNRTFETGAGLLFISNLTLATIKNGIFNAATALAHPLSVFTRGFIEQWLSGQSFKDLDWQRVAMGQAIIMFATKLGFQVKSGIKNVTNSKVALRVGEALAMSAATFPFTPILQPLLDADFENYYLNRYSRTISTDPIRKLIRFSLGWGTPAAIVVDEGILSLLESTFWGVAYPPYKGKRLWKEELPKELAKGHKNFENYLKEKLSSGSYINILPNITSGLRKYISEPNQKGFLEIMNESVKPENFTVLEEDEFSDLRDLIAEGGYDGCSEKMASFLEYLEKQDNILSQRLFHILALTTMPFSMAEKEKSKGPYEFWNKRPHVFIKLGIKQYQSLEREAFKGFVKKISNGGYDSLFSIKNDI